MAFSFDLRALLAPVAAGLVSLAAMPASAGVLFVTPTAPINAAPTLTFDNISEHNIGDPAYTIAGGSFDGLGIRFASYFAGQTLDFNGYPVLLTHHVPSAPLTLVTGDVNSYATIVFDAAANSFVMSGGPVAFLQPVAVQFDVPVPALAFTVGETFAVGALHIDVFDIDGNVLGSYSNDATGFLSIGITNVGGGPGIAGLSIHSNSFDGAFGIDNFYVAEGFEMPEPATAWVLGLALAALYRARHGAAGGRRAT